MAVDRIHVIHLGYLLAGVLAVFCLYLAFSPKSTVRSAARILWPFSSVEAPTRCTIHDLRPGDATGFYGDSVTISAEIDGLQDGESAMVIYSTADGQTVDQTIPMTRPDGEYRYQCRLPPDKRGLQQDYEYCVSAGDCRSRRYRIEVQTAPAIAVDKVVYHYPAYTELADRTVTGQDDLAAIEGTEVTLYGVSNVEIKPGTAEIDLDCTGRQGVNMSVDRQTAVGHFTLRLNPRMGRNRNTTGTNCDSPTSWGEKIRSRLGITLKWSAICRLTPGCSNRSRKRSKWRPTAGWTSKFAPRTPISPYDA